MNAKLLMYSTLVALCASAALNAATITLGGPLPTARTATLSSALAGAGNSSTGSGNATVTTVETAFGGDWTQRADVAGNGGPGNYSNGMLNVQVLTGSWGGNGPLTGNWTISNASFWTNYAQAAISMHVGNGGGEPDHFIWKLTPSAQSGTWSYDGTGLRGGGLSNLKLYSAGTGTPPGTGGGGRVPDGGTTLLSLGIALLGLGSMRKLVSAKA